MAVVLAAAFLIIGLVFVALVALAILNIGFGRLESSAGSPVAVSVFVAMVTGNAETASAVPVAGTFAPAWRTALTAIFVARKSSKQRCEESLLTWVLPSDPSVA